MDVGSIFPMYEVDFCKETDSYQNLPSMWENRLSLCREGFHIIASMKEVFRNHIVLIPDYTCFTVYEPFMQFGWTCKFYSIKRDLSIDVANLKNLYLETRASLCVIHPFYGTDLGENERTLIDKMQLDGCEIFEDLTQSIFKLEKGKSDYYVGSLRKWFPIPDGAYIYAKKKLPLKIDDLEEHREFVEDQTDAMYLRGVYFNTLDERTKKISIRINKRAMYRATLETTPHVISGLSEKILANENIQFNIDRRRNNLKCFYSHFKQGVEITLAIQDIERIKYAPLYIPLYCENRLEVQKKLAENRVYAPILWPVKLDEVLTNSEGRFIYEHLLAIPVDQNCCDEDMLKICNLLNNM